MGFVGQALKRAKVVASALFVFIPCALACGWSSAAAASNVTYPVIFIHGIASDASTWDKPLPDVSFRKMLEGWGWTFGGEPGYDSHNQVVFGANKAADFYTLNFSDNQNLSFAQQGAELYEIIKRVKDINNAQKVILVGHSMGGLAARAYLQGLGPQDLFKDDVQLLVTIGTPHRGSYLANALQDDAITVVFAEIKKIIVGAGIDPYSVAVTELRYDSCALNALNHNNTYNCVYNVNRPATDFHVSRWPPNDVTYTSIIGEAIVGKNGYGSDCPNTSGDFGDGVVTASSQNFIVSHAEFTNINIDCSPLPQVHTLETSNDGVWSVLSRILAGYKTQPPPPTLSPPTNFQISPQVSVAGDTINASWNGVVGADGYTASYGYSPGIYVGDLPLGNTTSYSTVPPLGTYYVALRAYNASTQSGYSNEVKIVVLGTPTLQSATQRCDGTTPGIDLAWSPVSGATNYEVWRNGSLIFTTNDVPTFWNTTGLTAGQSYTYQIKAKFGSTTSNFSNSMAQTAPNCATPPPAPTPSISSLSFTSVPADSTPRTLTIYGSNFAAGDVVWYRWLNPVGSNYASASVSSASQLSASFNPGAVTDTIYVKVCQSSTSTACSGELAIAVTATPPTAPAISSVSPNPVTGSASPQTITIYGTGFVNKPTLTLTWTGQPGYTVPTAQVTYVSSTQLQMAITTTTTSDNWTVKVTNPDGQVSNIAGFAVVAPTTTAPAPAISSVSPNPVTGSASPQTITIYGTGFVNKPTLTLTWTGQPGYTVPTAQVTYVSSTQLQMAITTTTTSDNWTVKVTNPDGQVSNIAGFAVVAPTTTPCTVSFNTSSVSIDASGGQRQVILTTSNSSCTWSAMSDQAWVHNITPLSGTAGATLTFTVDLNNSTQSRSATIRAGQATLTVSQLGTSVSCTFSLGYTTQSVPANGGTYLEGLFASNESCARTAQSNASFITNVFPASGNGTANISYTVAQNTSTSPRSGTLTIAGQTLTVNQDGAAPPCTYPGAFTLSATPYWDTGYPYHSIAASLSWTSSSNATNGYTIYRDGGNIGAVSGTTFLNNPNPPALLAGSSHSYYITASNTCGNTPSNTVPVTLTAQATVSNTSGGGLNLRSTAGCLTTACKIANLPDGTTVTVNGGPTYASVSSTSSGWWWYVNTSYGSGWVWGDYLY